MAQPPAPWCRRLAAIIGTGPHQIVVAGDRRKERLGPAEAVEQSGHEAAELFELLSRVHQIAGKDDEIGITAGELAHALEIVDQRHLHHRHQVVGVFLAGMDVGEMKEA